MRIIGNTVGTSLPKPDLRQTDPKKGDFVKGKEEFLLNSGGNVDIDAAVAKYLTENPVTGGMTQTEKNLILTLFRNAAYTSGNMGAVLTQLETIWSGSGDVPVNPEKTLTSISAVYSGGSVTAGTAVNDLTGIVVTAHYSDGTSATVTGYTLSGTIAEGENTITVSYGGKTTTFTVTGVAVGVSNETKWTDGVTYTFDWVENEYVKKDNGSFVAYEGWKRSPMLYCAGASRIDFTNANSQQAGYNALYDADKQFVQYFYPSTNGYIDIPEGVAYFAVSIPSAVVAPFSATPRA